MNKISIIFLAVTLTAISFFIFYFTAPSARKSLPAEGKREVTNRAAPSRNEGAVKSNGNIPDKSQNSSRTLSDTATPPSSAAQDFQIVSSTKSQVTIRYYSKATHHNLKLVNIAVNDIPVEMIFDTGASLIVFNTETVNRLGILTFSGPRVTQTPAGPTTAYLFMLSTIKLGHIELKNIECAYVPTSRDNLLGGSFLSNFTYSINEEDRTITFIPRGEKIQYTGRGIQTSPGHGWAEFNGVKYLYKNGKLEKAD